MREKLIDLIKGIKKYTEEYIVFHSDIDDETDTSFEELQAEYLLKNGVVVLPCNVGDTVFDISDGTPYETRVICFAYFGDHWACRTVSGFPDLVDFGTRIFLTKEEAEKALEKQKQGGE